MDNETNAGLIAAVAERDRRIAELTESLLNAADKIDATESRLAAMEAALREIAKTNIPELLDPVTRSAIVVLSQSVRDALSGGTAALDAVVRAAVDAERQTVANMREAIRDLGTTLDALIGGARVEVDRTSPNAAIGRAQLKRLRAFAEGHDAGRRDVDEAIRASERAAIRARVGDLQRYSAEPSERDPDGTMLDRADVLAAIGAAGGAS